MLSTVKSNIDSCYVLIGHVFIICGIFLNISKESILKIIEVGNNIEIKNTTLIKWRHCWIFVNYGIYQMF